MKNNNASPQSNPPICPYCNVATRIATGLEIHPNRSDSAENNYWLCDPCGAYVGCHNKTSVALGIPADRETRLARQHLHIVIDDIWKKSPNLYNFGSRKNAQLAEVLSASTIKRARNRVYEWLGHSLGLNHSLTHVGMFDLETCAKAISAMDSVTYEDIREWAREVEAKRFASLVDATMAPIAAAAGLTIGVTGPKTPNAEDFYRDKATIWLRLAQPLGLTLKLDSAFDVGFAEAASDLGIPFSIVVNPLQKSRSDENRIRASLIAATKLHVVNDEKNCDPWISVRRDLISRIDALAVLPAKLMDPLTRIAFDSGKTLFNIRNDLIVNGCEDVSGCSQYRNQEYFTTNSISSEDTIQPPLQQEN